MRIRMISGLDGRYRAGEEVDVGAGLAGRLIGRGYAVPVRAVEVERAVVGETGPELAVPTPKKRRTYRRKAKG